MPIWHCLYSHATKFKLLSCLLRPGSGLCVVIKQFFAIFSFFIQEKSIIYRNHIHFCAFHWSANFCWWGRELSIEMNRASFMGAQGKWKIIFLNNIRTVKNMLIFCHFYIWEECMFTIIYLNLQVSPNANLNFLNFHSWDLTRQLWKDNFFG